MSPASVRKPLLIFGGWCLRSFPGRPALLQTTLLHRDRHSRFRDIRASGENKYLRWRESIRSFRGSVRWPHWISGMLERMLLAVLAAKLNRAHLRRGAGQLSGNRAGPCRARDQFDGSAPRRDLAGSRDHPRQEFQLPAHFLDREREAAAGAGGQHRIGCQLRKKGLHRDRNPHGEARLPDQAHHPLGAAQ